MAAHGKSLTRDAVAQEQTAKTKSADKFEDSMKVRPQRPALEPLAGTQPSAICREGEHSNDETGDKSSGPWWLSQYRSALTSGQASMTAASRQSYTFY